MTNTYPEDWAEIANRIKCQANWKCERCKHPNEKSTGHVLTVHHMDGDKTNCSDWNLAALCQRCHLSIQGRVKMDQMFFTEILDVSEWFKPHLVGYLQSIHGTDIVGVVKKWIPSGNANVRAAHRQVNTGR